MGNIFAGGEIVEMGVQIEKNGRDFYRAVAAKSKAKKAREAFDFLAGEEEKHIAAFERILKSVQAYEPPEAYPGEYFAYMKALADGHVFTKKAKGEEAAKSAASDKKAIEIGIGFEKDSIIFYEGMKRVAPEDDRKIIDQLILQEEGHLTQLSELKKKL
jgi:rubrerythrin